MQERSPMAHTTGIIWRQHAPEWAQPAQRRSLIALTALVVFAIAIMSVGIGSIFIPPSTTLKILLARSSLVDVRPDWPEILETILLDIRLPRVVLVGLTGAALACSGVAYQSVFRNPLADPYLIGVASGAGLGAVVVIALRLVYPTISPLNLPGGAFVGGISAVALVYTLGRVGQSTPTTTLILAGVAVGALATAMTTFILMRVSHQAVRMLAFLLGGYSNASWGGVQIVLPVTLIGCVVLFLYARPLNLLQYDEEQAQQLGINVMRVKLVVIVVATMITAVVVAFNGVIGFVGLVVPHVARMLVGPDHRRLMPLATLGGVGFLLLADMIARTAIAPEELPLGVITAFAGAPFFLYVLRRTKHAAFF